MNSGFSAFAFWWACIEAEREIGEESPYTDDQIILSYMGCGASAVVTVGDIRNMLREAGAKPQRQPE